MDNKKKEELLKIQRESRQKKSSCKKNEVSDEDGEWLSKNDNYQRESIHTPSQEEEIITAGIMATHSFLR